ncbi:MAG: 23S rRNA (guanosine(2251)-2'-O)-methyltransferase RlmB [Anaerolineae bacterium]
MAIQVADTLYGRHAVLEALRAGRRKIRRLFIAQGVRERGAVQEILNIASRESIPVQRVQRTELDKLGAVNHQGVAAEASGYPYVTLAEILDAAKRSHRDPLVLILDHLQDPQNLGTLLRTAEAVGVAGVIIPDRRAASITPAVSNASAGAVEHLQITQVANLAQTIQVLKEEGFWVAGLERTEDAVPITQADFSGPLALVVGSEGKGMSRLVRERCDWLIMLPMAGRVTSLNAAVAGSVVLYLAWSARQATGDAANPAEEAEE